MGGLKGSFSDCGIYFTHIVCVPQSRFGNVFLLLLGNPLKLLTAMFAAVTAVKYLVFCQLSRASSFTRLCIIYTLFNVFSTCQYDKWENNECMSVHV